MSMNHRIDQIHRDRRSVRRQYSPPTAKLSHRQQIRAYPKHLAENHLEAVNDGVANHWLVTQRKSLEEVEPIWVLRWLLRKYFQWRGFACRSHCGDCDGKCYANIEYRGTFDNQVDARWAANCTGGEVKPVPFNAALPEETVSYGVGDVPQSEASPFYRRGVTLPFIAVPREEIAERNVVAEKIERLREKIRATDPVMEEFRAKAI